MIKRLHHSAYRCRDSEETRRFYEDFLGLPLCASLEIRQSKSGRSVEALHTFYRLEDGSYPAFFEVPDQPLEIQSRGIADHEMIDSIYFRDPNGYVIELAAKRENHDLMMDPLRNDARAKLDAWEAGKDDRPRTAEADPGFSNDGSQPQSQ